MSKSSQVILFMSCSKLVFSIKRGGQNHLRGRTDLSFDYDDSTSGTTASPKGVVRFNGGHAVASRMSMQYTLGLSREDTIFCASDFVIFFLLSVTLVLFTHTLYHFRDGLSDIVTASTLLSFWDALLLFLKESQFFPTRAPSGRVSCVFPLVLLFNWSSH